MSTSLSSEVYNAALLVSLILLSLWLLHSCHRCVSLYLLSSAYKRHELLHVEGLSRHSNLTRDHLLSILRARSTHIALPTERFAVHGHVDTSVGKLRRTAAAVGAVKQLEADTPDAAALSGEDVCLQLRVSCTRVCRLDVFVGVQHSAIAQLYHDSDKARRRHNKAMDSTRCAADHRCSLRRFSACSPACSQRTGSTRGRRLNSMSAAGWTECH
jgi:hypothetical protein